ncbi:cyclin-dependent kinase inhibitor 5 [Ziziphus jujuba]|uniref:Cyclin-dependent kinase inhibitor 5 n=1 Tax=Ziziphus jujuba TaxID=326968 RepID=A0ABM3IRQ8_ZIZJJ|nr:cyclin-dependent kinase inhibitor 5 [Ziziphus jujuba]
MGKYMRKTKAAGEVAVMEVAQSSLGVRTRAKTLALQRLQKSPAKTPAPAPAATSSGSYLQLRSRRLEKPPIVMPNNSEHKRQSKGAKLGCVHNSPKATNPNPRTSSRLRVGSVASGSHGSVSIGVLNGEDGEKGIEAKEIVGKEEEEVQENNNTANGDLGIEEASCGENLLDFEGRERSTRESTPCNLIRDPDVIRTPGSSTRPTNSAETSRRIQNSSRRHVPTTREMDEFFAGAEEEQQKQFIKKYNFDPVTDTPLPGRYEWEKVDP